jgi:hypothetical protein
VSSRAYYANHKSRKRGKPATATTAQAGVAGVGMPPLQWWRVLPADAFTPVHLATIRRCMSGIGMIGEPRWPDAVNGDAAAAVGIALKTINRRDALGAIIDLHASTLLIPALAGDGAAIAVLIAMIDRHPEALGKEQLSRSWLRHQRPTKD